MLSINAVDEEPVGMVMLLVDEPAIDIDMVIDDMGIVIVAEVAGLRFDTVILLESIDIDIGIPPPMYAAFAPYVATASHTSAPLFWTSI